ncbi:MAG: PqqD family protein [Novosphingobium sp.]|uniref:PqqD family protein n=1 Tax=Novosphingobium sp. TaxID=1874826 RepID=UPI003C7C63DB
MSTKLAKATDRFSETAIDDEIVVMSLESGDFFSLTGTGRAIWQLVDGTRDRAALLRDLAEGFTCSEEDIASDVDDFLDRLTAAGLLAGG